MPRKIDGRQLTAKQHRQWKKVRAKTGSAAAATAAVKRSMRSKRRS